MSTAHSTAGVNHTSTVCLRACVIARLQRSPADEAVLARCCNVPLHVMRYVAAELVAAGELVHYHDKLAVPLTPARPIVIPQFHWGSTRLA